MENDVVPQNSVFSNGSKKKYILLGVLLFLLLLNGTGLIQKTFSFMGHSYVESQNDNYITKSLKEATGTFLMLSLFKSGLAILQSSQAGVSLVVDVEVQVGEFVQALKEVVDIAWRVMFLAVGILTFLKILLPFFSTFGQFCLSLFIVGIIFYYLADLFLPRYRRLTIRLSMLFCSLTLAFYVIVPLGVFGASLVSRKLTNPLLETSQAAMNDVRSDFSVEREGFGFRRDFENILKKFASRKLLIKRKLETFTKNAIQYIVILIFNIFFFPLGLVIILYLFFDRVIRGLFYSTFPLLEKRS